MTSREIVRRTLAYEGPERVARSFGESDFVGAGCAVKGPTTGWTEAGRGRWERTDLWGNVWARVDSSSKGEVVRGALENLDDLGDYGFPDFSRSEDYEGVRAQRKEFPDKWLRGGIPGFAFNIARKMLKLDNYFVALMLDRDRLRILHDRLDACVEDMIRNYAEAGVDCVMLGEDWGTQTNTLVKPDLWYEEFYPRFKRLCGLAHDLGLPVFMHSCGQTEEIMPGLMDAGVDCFQFDQPDLHGIDTLALHQERAKATFWCPVDIQSTLQTHDEGVIRAKAREMLGKLWKGRGGFIAGYYGDNVSIGLDPKWQEIACDEFVKYGIADRLAGTRPG